MSSTSARRSRVPGFSLIELLVVIGIIGVLLGILLPVIASARRAARSTACLAAVHQWGVAFQAYLSAHHGRSFAGAEEQGAYANPPLWWEQLEPYHPDVERTLLCPEATETTNREPPPDAFHAWGPHYLWPEPGRTRLSYVGSYGINGWLYRSVRAGGGGGDGPGATGAIRMPARQADRVPVIFDSAYFYLTPSDTDRTDFDPDDTIVMHLGWMRLAALRRHGVGVNVAFLDGHAEHVSAEGLWRLRWSETFTPRDVHLPD